MATILKRELRDGTPRYKAIIRRKGTPTRAKTFRTRAKANAWITKTEATILDHKQLPTVVEERRTVADLIAEYRTHVLPTLSPGTKKPRAIHLTWWEGVLGEKRLLDVTRQDIVTALRVLSAGGSVSGRPSAPATRNRYLASLRHAWSVAQKDWEWVAVNPCTGMISKEPRGRVRFLSDDERERLLRACRDSSEKRLYPLVVLALATGARQQELLSLRWSDVDLERRVAIVEDSKNDERRSLPLSSSAISILGEFPLPHEQDGFIFANRWGKATYPREAFDRALLEAELEDFRFHDLRHTAASYLAMSGASLVELATILGHKTLSMVKRYAHLTEEHSAALLERMDGRFLNTE